MRILFYNKIFIKTISGHTMKSHHFLSTRTHRAAPPPKTKPGAVGRCAKLGSAWLAIIEIQKT